MFWESYFVCGLIHQPICMTVKLSNVAVNNCIHLFIYKSITKNVFVIGTTMTYLDYLYHRGVWDNICRKQHAC